jgi:hypothetical protein
MSALCSLPQLIFSRAAASSLRVSWFVVLVSFSPTFDGQPLSQRTFLKGSDTRKNVPIYAICLSLYEPVPGVSTEKIGSEVIRTQWLYVSRSSASLSYLNLWPDSPEAGEILLGKRVLIVVRASLSGGVDATLIGASLQDEVDDSRKTLQ